MKEVLYEETSKINDSKITRNYILVTVAAYVFTALTIFVAVFFVYVCDFKRFYDGTIPNLILNISLWAVPFIVCLLFAIFFFKKKKKICAEYDYSFLTGTVRIAMIPKNGRRLAVTKFDSNCIERIGKVGSGTYNTYLKTPMIKKRKCTANKVPSDNCEFYYIVANYDEQKHLYIFDCTELFIKNVLAFSGKYVLESDGK